jgi:hypothetical protein
LDLRSGTAGCVRRPIPTLGSSLWLPASLDTPAPSQRPRNRLRREVRQVPLRPQTPSSTTGLSRAILYLSDRDVVIRERRVVRTKCRHSSWERVWIALDEIILVTSLTAFDPQSWVDVVGQVVHCSIMPPQQLGCPRTPGAWRQLTVAQRHFRACGSLPIGTVAEYDKPVTPAATIRLYRGRGNLMDPGWAFRMQIDGSEVGDIRTKQSKDFEVSPGDHWFRLLSAFPGRGSGKREVSLAADEIKVFYCYTNILGLVDVRIPNQKDIAKLHQWFPDLTLGAS